MKICHLIFFITVVLFLAVIHLGLNDHLFSVNASSVNISAVVISLCGNGDIDPGEQCDSSNLNDQTCESLGSAGGTLSCSYCAFDTSGCTGEVAPPPLPIGGGYVPPQTIVIFEGKASPGSKVILLKDAQMVATAIAGDDANFQITLSGLSGGNYIFSVYSEDKEGRRSSLLVFPINVTTNATTKVSGVFIGPTIAVDKEEVKKGEDILVSGESVPKANIRIFLKSKEKEFSVDTVADNEGKYSYSFNTDSLDFEEYQITVIAFVDNVSSNLSRIIFFTVGTETIFKKPLPKCPLIGDFNNDCLVNLIDFSILIYWFDRPNPPTQIDLSKDGKVDLVDFSIMAYSWTG